MIKRIQLWGVFLFLFLLGGCKTVIPYNAELFRANENNCWPCKMYLQAFKAVDSLLEGALTSISENSLAILKLGLIFWLLFKITTLLVSFSMPDMKKEMANFATMFFKAGLVAIFLNNPDFIYDFFGGIVIQPLGKIFLYLSDTVISSPSAMGIDFDNYNNAFGNMINTISDWVRGLLGFGGAGSASEMAENLNSRMFGGLAESVMRIVFKIYNALWAGVGLGFQLWQQKGWSATIAGLFLIAGMYWLVLVMPLTFVDAFVRIGLVLILLPLLMVGWVFSFPSKDLVKKVFHMVLAGFFDILFACIYVTFLVSLFRVYSTEEMPWMFSSAVQTTEGGMRTVASNWGTDFLILLMLTWAMVKLSGKIQDFSGYFFASAEKSSVINIINTFKNWGMKLGRIGVSLATGNYAKAAKETADAAKDAAGQATGSGNKGNSQQSGIGEKRTTRMEYDALHDRDVKGDFSDKGKSDNSQKASKQNSAPKPKAGNK